MDDTEDDARYPPNPYAATQDFQSSHRSKLPVCNAYYPHNVGDQFVEGEDDTEIDEEDEEEGDGNEEDNIQLNGKVKDVDDEDDVLDEDEDENDDHDEENNLNNYRRIESADQHRQPKKRKIKSLLSSYEFAPRVAAPLATASSASKPNYGGRNALSDWTERQTYVLLDAWGDRFLQRRRKSLRSEEWQEVAEKVSQESKLERSDTQCRNRLDTLKKKYKNEKMKLQGMVDNTASKWVHFKKMDMLLSSTPQQLRFSHRVNSVNSGEYIVRNPRVSLNRARGLDEMRNSSVNSEKAEGNGSGALPPKRTNRGNGASFRLLAESITKFIDIYEKIESSKRKQMLELEKMRMDFHRELEMRKRQILERATTEIANIQEADIGESNDRDCKYTKRKCCERIDCS